MSKVKTTSSPIIICQDFKFGSGKAICYIPLPHRLLFEKFIKTFTSRHPDKIQAGYRSTLLDNHEQRHSTRLAIRKWTGVCKVNKLTKTSLETVLSSNRRFEHRRSIYPLSKSKIRSDNVWFSRWFQAVPMENIEAGFHLSWLPARVTSDRGTQLESRIFSLLLKSYGITRHRTSAYNPKANGAKGSSTTESSSSYIRTSRWLGGITSNCLAGHAHCH